VSFHLAAAGASRSFDELTPASASDRQEVLSSSRREPGTPGTPSRSSASDRPPQADPCVDRDGCDLESAVEFVAT